MYTREEAQIINLAYQGGLIEQQSKLQEYGLENEGWAIEKAIDDFGNSLHASLLVNKEKRIVALAIAGVQILHDWGTAIDGFVLIPTNNLPSSLPQAQNIFEEAVKKANSLSYQTGEPYTISIMGHSLGGAIAQLLTIQNPDVKSVRCLSLESPGLRSLCAENNFLVSKEVESRISIHLSKYPNVVNSYNEHLVEPRFYSPPPKINDLLKSIIFMRGLATACEKLGANELADSYDIGLVGSLLFYDWVSHDLESLIDSPDVPLALESSVLIIPSQSKSDDRKDVLIELSNYQASAIQPQVTLVTFNSQLALSTQLHNSNLKNNSPTTVKVAGVVTASGMAGALVTAETVVGQGTTLALIGELTGESVGIGFGLTGTAATVTGGAAVAGLAAYFFYKNYCRHKDKKYKENLSKIEEKVRNDAKFIAANIFIEEATFLDQNQKENLRTQLESWYKAEVCKKDRESFVKDRAWFFEKGKGRKDLTKASQESAEQKQVFQEMVNNIVRAHKTKLEAQVSNVYVTMRKNTPHDDEKVVIIKHRRG